MTGVDVDQVKAEVRNWFGQASQAAYYGPDGDGADIPDWLRAAVDQLPPAGRALDVGCGTGRLTRYLASAGRAAVGVDASPELLSIARSWPGRTPADATPSGADSPAPGYVEATLGDSPLPFADGAFGAMLCVNAICYVPGIDRRGAALREMCRVLSPAGRLFIANHVVPSDIDIADALAEDESHQQWLRDHPWAEPGDTHSGDGHGYVHWFTADELNHLVARDFEVTARGCSPDDLTAWVIARPR